MIILLVLLQGSAAERLKAGVDAALAAKSFTYAFDLKTEIPHSDPFQAKGRGVATHSQTLFSEYQGTGGIDKKIVVTPKGSLIWHAFLEDWVTGEEYGDPGAGHGFQNPFDLLAVIKERTGVAADAEGGLVKLRFEGPAALEMLGKLRVDPGRLKADGTWTEVVATLRDGRLASLRSTAHINFADTGDAQAPGHFEYDVTVTVEAYDRDEKMTWKGIDVDAALKRLATK